MPSVLPSYVPFLSWLLLAWPTYTLSSAACVARLHPQDGPATPPVHPSYISSCFSYASSMTPVLLPEWPNYIPGFAPSAC